MKNKERKAARRYDTANRCSAFTKRVYSGFAEDKEKLKAEIFASEKEFYPKKVRYNIYFGELHGHSNMSDGRPSPYEYFKNIRDNAGLDFAALTDHDHGGIGHNELFGEKWEEIKAVVKSFNEPGRFTTILGYERDSYPWYNNLAVYYDSYDGELLRGSNDGEITKQELLHALNRDDLLLVPHDTYSLEAGADFNAIEPELFTGMIEIYSRGDSAEYFGNPQNTSSLQCEGGFWQDALKRGAKMGCIAASDDHDRENGLVSDRFTGIARYPGITGVLAEENTLSSIFSALKARRCYGFTGGRMWIDFRINGHYMGEEFADSGERSIYFNVKADSELERVTLVKNCRDYMIIKRNEQLIYDYRAEKPTDIYYLRVELKDGRIGWTSPIWINHE
ncbi:MAG: DUF3604 domain-containing protein [Clostridia bacterium]|nr:DUF3604 domain-containing protein [Clostridia bacterium]